MVFDLFGFRFSDGLRVWFGERFFNDRFGIFYDEAGLAGRVRGRSGFNGSGGGGDRNGGWFRSWRWLGFWNELRSKFRLWSWFDRGRFDFFRFYGFMFLDFGRDKCLKFVLEVFFGEGEGGLTDFGFVEF